MSNMPHDYIDLYPHTKPVNITEFNTPHAMADKSLDERITAALGVFFECVLNTDHNPLEHINHIDKTLLDYYIAQIDHQITEKLNAVMHHPDFQALESLWSSLKYLTDKIDFRANIKLEILDIDKTSLLDDFNDASDTSQSGLYNHIYTQEYDMPGGEPISAMISDFHFDASHHDIVLLREISKVAAVTHCPFIGNIGAAFFHKNTLDDVMQIHDLAHYLERAEYIRWNAFRETDDARYIGLTLPQFLLRLPYGHDNPVKLFNYTNQAHPIAEKYLWGKSSFAFAANMATSFKQNGWTVNIRGPESGGKVHNLPLHYYDAGRGLHAKIPTEILIPETRELEFAQAGFIPLSYYKNSDFACFFSANSVQKPLLYDSSEATANSRINARLPYIFLSARLGHYLKVLQRENIGSPKNRDGLQAELNRWLQTLVTKMNNPGPELAATHPLREGHVDVLDIPDNPGYYRINLFAIPHFQVEGIDVRLSLVAQMPVKIGE